jgi:hypothetical protein
LTDAWFALLPLLFVRYYHLSLRRYYGRSRMHALLMLGVLVVVYALLVLVAAGAVLLTLGGLEPAASARRRRIRQRGAGCAGACGAAGPGARCSAAHLPPVLC